jgi:hypothetical protein
MEVSMSRMATSVGLVLGLVMASAGPAHSEEKKIDRAAVPAAVLAAVAKKYPGAKMVAFEEADEEGKKLYEIGIESDGTKMDVELTADGKIEGEETVIRDADLPASVKAGLASSRYKGWKVDKIEKVVKQEKTDNPLYELVVRSKSKKFEVVFDKDGKVTKEEDKSKAKDGD